MLRSLLVAVDLSPISDRVVGRVPLLPLAGDARLTLLHVVANLRPAHARRTAERDAKKALAAEVEALTRELPRTVAIRPVVEVGAPAAAITACAASARAELIVMGRGGGRAIRDLFLGSTAERVIRQGKLPVLVVRQRPRARYRRPALALDLEPVARDVLDLLCRVTLPPRPRTAIIHAYRVPFDTLIYPSLPSDEAEELRADYRQRAIRELSKLLATGFAEAGIPREESPPWSTHVQYGSARTIIEHAVKKLDIDLLLLGTHGYTGMAHAFLGTVAGDVLRNVVCDVLVVPPRQAA